MAGIFINYRTGDGSDAAALLDNVLTREFGDGMVFKDSRSLQVGRDFPPELKKRLKESTVLIAIIGPQWLTATRPGGARCLDDPKDYVRWEIRKALKREITVIPLLLEDTPLPKVEELPEDISKLTCQQFRNLRMRYEREDLRVLVEELKKEVPALPVDAAAASLRTVKKRNAKARKGVAQTGDGSHGFYLESPAQPPEGAQ